MSWSEEKLHQWLAENPPGAPLVGSAGHDAAVLRPARGRPVLCFDQTIEGVHVDAALPPRAIGRKAVSRVFSDLAATGARPHAVGLALRAPSDYTESRLRSVVGAVRARALEFGAELIGGDTAAAPGPLSLAVTAFGSVSARIRPPGRDRARSGQALLLTGPVGGSLLGRHWKFEPRLELGAWLHSRGATALMDVSDGLALDAWRLARASGVRLRIESVPVHRDARRMARRTGRDPLEHALYDGEDYELLATVPSKAVPRLLRSAAEKGWPLHVLGRVERGSGLVLDLPDGEATTFDRRAPRGWVHGD